MVDGIFVFSLRPLTSCLQDNISSLQLNPVVFLDVLRRVLAICMLSCKSTPGAIHQAFVINSITTGSWTLNDPEFQADKRASILVIPLKIDKKADRQLWDAWNLQAPGICDESQGRKGELRTDDMNCKRVGETFVSP